MTELRVWHLNHSDNIGGAARAAYRIHQALRGVGADSRMFVQNKSIEDETVQGPHNLSAKLAAQARPHIAQSLNRALDRTLGLKSSAILPSRWSSKVNSSDIDVVNLHWVNHEMMSIEDIGRIRKPAVWTLHDMWAFSGSRHVHTDDYWWKYSSSLGFKPTFWDHHTWKRKLEHWKRPLSIIAPSHWMAEQVQRSALMQHWPVYVVPNCIDIEKWRPLTKALCREILGLPLDGHIILFGAMGGTNDPNKGFDLLSASLPLVRAELSDTQLMVFGGMGASVSLPVHSMGKIVDDLSLNLIYSAADVVVIPSRLENLPNTALEASACGTPVVGFDIGGMKDVVEHKGTGYLAPPFDIEELANGIVWCLSDDQRRSELAIAARLKAVNEWSYSSVTQKYIEVYRLAAKF